MSAVAKRKEEQLPAAPAPMSEGAALVSMLERAARDPSVDISKMERLFELHQQAMARKAKTEFLAALSELQAELPAVERKGTGHNQKKYARFEDFVETIKEYLAKHGFSLTYRITQETSAIKIAGVLGHKGGHQEDTSLTLPTDNTGNKNPVQAHGSTISYGKRYVGMTLLGIATEDEDDDGQKAGGASPISEDQVASIKSLIVDTNSDIGRFCAYFKVKAIEDLPATSFDRAVAALKKKASA